MLADQMKATVYVAGAENDASFTPEQAETPGQGADLGERYTPDRDLSGRTRIRRP